jgi:hypothetical protein
MKAPDWMSDIERRKLKWLAWNQTRIAKPENRRKLGRPRLGWLEDVRNDLRQLKEKWLRQKGNNTGWFISPSWNPDNNLESLCRANTLLQGYCDSKLLSGCPEGLMNYSVQSNWYPSLKRPRFSQAQRFSTSYPWRHTSDIFSFFFLRRTGIGV